MKNEKGITLISLVTTVILVIVLAGITTYSGIESYNGMREQAFVTKMIALQEKVDIFCDKYSVTEINSMGVGFSEAGSEEKAVLNDVISSSSTLKSWFSVDNATGNYRYFSISAISEKIGLDNFDVGIWLNPLTRNVIAVEGIKIDGTTYYRQYDLSGGQTLKEPVINTNTTLNCSVQTYDNKADIKLEQKYQKITCNLMNGTTIVSSKVFTNTDTIGINTSGIYKIIATDDYGNEKTSANVSITIVNKPLLVEGMTPVSLNGTTVKEITTEEAKKDWYNYDSSENRWANVKLKDGSIYVWIPRYAYKINSTNKTIDVKFLSEFSNITTEDKPLDTGYRVMPAFQNGVGTGFANGEWDSEILGFWVAKYEPIKNGSAPKSINQNAQIWGNITPQAAFELCRNMEATYKSTYFGSSVELASGSLKDGIFPTDNNNIDTHLMKNSEWGAVAYLAKSQYGRGGSPNNKTGLYPHEQLTQEFCTTTKNLSGVFGLVGGKREMVAAGPTIFEKNASGTILINLNSSNVSTKYATVYKNDIASESIYGDAMKDTMSWGQANSALSSKLITRGGINTGSNNSIFTYEHKDYAADNNCTFRPVIIVEY